MSADYQDSLRTERHDERREIEAANQVCPTCHGDGVVEGSEGCCIEARAGGFLCGHDCPDCDGSGLDIEEPPVDYDEEGDL